MKGFFPLFPNPPRAAVTPAPPDKLGALRKKAASEGWKLLGADGQFYFLSAQDEMNRCPDYGFYDFSDAEKFVAARVRGSRS
jgi:hypothetical protein